MLVGTSQGITELSAEFCDPLLSPGKGDPDILEPAEIQTRRPARRGRVLSRGMVASIPIFCVHRSAL
jgi:hypothetical protein